MKAKNVAVAPVAHGKCSHHVAGAWLNSTQGQNVTNYILPRDTYDAFMLLFNSSTP